jgi:polyribonucleotide nucleotidyltransferase
MGSVCASTLSLLNAGVPLRAPVAGIAMGLVSDQVDGQTRYAALTDILGAEDALGDMDFKVAGTSEFVTAIQLDTKLDGIPSSVLSAALTQAKDARMTILGVLNAAIDGPDEMAPTAPRVISVQIPVDKIGELIGPKGKTINAIQDETGAQISIEEDGTVYIGATDGPSAEAARAQVNAIANPTNPEVGEQFLGTVVKLATFGAFVSLSRQGRPAAHQRGAQARRRQARRERRGRARRRPEDPRPSRRSTTAASCRSSPCSRRPPTRRVPRPRARVPVTHPPKADHA